MGLPCWGMPAGVVRSWALLLVAGLTMKTAHGTTVDRLWPEERGWPLSWAWVQTLPKATWHAALSSSASWAVLGLRPSRVPRLQSALRATSRSPDSIEKLTD